MEGKIDETRPVELAPRLSEALRRLPVPAPRPDFAQRVLAAARPSRPRLPMVLACAMAASLVSAVGLGLWLEQSAQPMPAAQPAVAEGKVVALVPGEARSVRLAFRSPRSLEDVTIHLQLPAGVELAGYPGRQSLRWQASFQRGANLLELPLIVHDGEGGILTATLDYGTSHKAFTVQVRTQRPAALFPDVPATSVVTGRYST